MIQKKGWFSDLEIVERDQQVNNEEYQIDPTTQTETLNTERQETPSQTETKNNENRFTTHPNTTKQRLTDDYMNVDLLKKNMT